MKEVQGTDGDSVFFIVGCERSGTTLMRLVLECHSRITCIDEPMSCRVISRLARSRRCGSLVGLKTPCVTEQFYSPSLYDPFFLSRPNPLYQQAASLFESAAGDAILPLGFALHRRYFRVALNMPSPKSLL
jgi:hypothetical protein